MSDASTRFTLSGLLSTLVADPPAPIDTADLAALVDRFRRECAVLVAECPPEAVPLRLPKARIRDLLACELGAVASLRGGDLSEPIVRGVLTDQLVAQHLAASPLRPAAPTPGASKPDAPATDAPATDAPATDAPATDAPATDAPATDAPATDAPATDTGTLADDLRDGLAAAGASDVLEWIAEADDEARTRLWAHCELVRANLVTSWGALDRRWWPRAQERVTVEVADGVLVLSAQFDLALGGAPTGLPLVVVEVKAGASADRNRADLLWYGLLAALRYGHAPATVATWTAEDDGLVPVPVTLGALEAAARRGLAALASLVELACGREPRATPHAGCTWCPARADCGPGQRWINDNAPNAEAEAAAVAGGLDE